MKGFRASTRFLSLAAAMAAMAAMGANSAAAAGEAAGGSGGAAGAFENPAGIKEIYAVILSHLDIGFTATPDAVAAGQKPSLDAAARLVRENADLVWTIESVWQLEEWLKRTGDRSEIEGMLSLIRSGRIALGALPASFHTAILPEECFSRIALPAARLRRRHGIPAEVAIQDDVPGFSWALPRSLAGSARAKGSGAARPS